MKKRKSIILKIEKRNLVTQLDLIIGITSNYKRDDRH